MVGCILRVKTVNGVISLRTQGTMNFMDTGLSRTYKEVYQGRIRNAVRNLSALDEFTECYGIKLVGNIYENCGEFGFINGK